MEQNQERKIIPYILLTGLLTGTMDALFAIIPNPQIPPAMIFRYIASGAYGSAAFSQGTEMVYYGILFHFCIALVWTAAFFMLYTSLLSIMKSRFALVITIGLVIWIVMNLLVVPLSYVHTKPFNIINGLKNIVILMLAFGLPVTLIADRFYETRPYVKSAVFSRKSEV